MMEKEDLISALFTAFATFIAFGAAIAGLLAAGGVVQTLASWWAEHGKTKALTKRNPKKRQKRLELAQRMAPTAIGLAASIIITVVLISAAGLVFSFFWLYGYAKGSKVGWGWAYYGTIWLFCAEIALLTLATVSAVVAATISANNASKLADSSSDLDDAVRTVAVGCLDGQASAKRGSQKTMRS